MSRCRCTNEELRQVGGADGEALVRFFALYAGEVTWPAGAEGIDPQAVVNAEEVEQDIAFLRLVCYRVIEARDKKNVHAEQRALGPGQRWGDRDHGRDAPTYIASNVLVALGKEPLPILNHAKRQELRYMGRHVWRSGGFPKPFNPKSFIG